MWWVYYRTGRFIMSLWYQLLLRSLNKWIWDNRNTYHGKEIDNCVLKYGRKSARRKSLGNNTHAWKNLNLKEKVVLGLVFYPTRSYLFKMHCSIVNCSPFFGYSHLIPVRIFLLLALNMSQNSCRHRFDLPNISWVLRQGTALQFRINSDLRNPRPPH